MNTRLSSVVSRTVVHVYEKVSDGWGFLPDILERVFRDSTLSAADRGRVVALAHDMVRWRRAAQFVLADENPNPSHVLALSRFLSGEGEEVLSGLPADRRETARNFVTMAQALGDPVERVGVRWSFPPWIARVMVEELGEERAALLAPALNRDAPHVVRVNSLKGTVEDARAALSAEGLQSHPAGSAPLALIVEPAGFVYRTNAFREGRVEVQDQASQLVCELVAPPPGGTVVDACAGAGGKTLGVGALMGGRGRIIAVDTHGGRLAELKRRCRRAGVSNVQVIHPERDQPANIPAASADRVLVDAPCTGLGALRRNPEARWRVTAGDLERLTAQQEALVTGALKWVKPGGRLIYATCSFTRAEGEDVVARVRAAHPGLVPVPVREILGRARTEGFTDPDGMNFRSWPDRHDMDGFFCAVLRVPR